MEMGTAIGTEPDNVTRIGGNLRLDERDMKHVLPSYCRNRLKFPDIPIVFLYGAIRREFPRSGCIENAHPRPVLLVVVS